MPGNLVAYACKESWEKGYQGFVAFVSKTKLIRHYEETLGARCIGGQQGFEWAHTQLGTWLTIAGTAAAGFVFVRIGTGGGPRPLRTGGISACLPSC